MKYTKERIEAEVSEGAAESLVSLRESEEVPQDMKENVGFQHIWVIGCWLQPALEATGMSEEEAATVCSEHGQRSFHTNPYEVAAWILNEIQAGTFTPTPMKELGEQLMKEHTRVEMRDGKRTVIMKVWSPESGASLLDTVEKIRNLPPEERDAAIAKLEAEMAELAGKEPVPSESRA